MAKYKSMVKIHYDGEIAENHQIPMRILGKAIVHIQKSLDRAYLDIKYKGIWKYARMTQEDYVKTEYLVQSPEEGGYILSFFSKVKGTKKVAERVASAITQVIQQSSEQVVPLRDQVENKKRLLLNKQIHPVNFKDLLENPGEQVVRQYGDRSIAKEIDQVVSTIRQDYAGDSTFELSITGSSTKNFPFNRESSQRFHEIVSKRNIGIPVIFQGNMDELSIKNKRAKFINSLTHKTSIVHLSSEEDVLKIHPYVIPEKKITFIGCPLIEFGSLEPYSGDIYFIDLYDNEENNAQQSH